MHTNQLYKFLHILQKLPKAEAAPPTFLQLIKSDQKENTISNLLAFYFNPKEAHGLGDLFLRALFHSLGKYDEYTAQEHVEVIREQTTTDNKRIDILLRTENWAIAIEHKINHSLINPLKSYETYLTKKYPNTAHYGIVLTPVVKTSKEENEFFQTILHRDFLSNVKKLLGFHLPSLTQNNYLFYLLDFIHTMENREQESKLEPELMGFVGEHYEEFLSGYQKLKAVENYIGNKIRALKKTLDSDTINQYTERIEVWSQELGGVLYFKLKPLVVDKDVNELLQFKLRLKPKGWTLEFWKVNESISLFQKLALLTDKSKRTVEDAKKEVYFVFETLDYNIDENIIKAKVEELFRSLYQNQTI